MTPEEMAEDIYKRAFAAKVAEHLGEVIAGVEDTAAQVEKVTGHRIVHRRPAVLDATRPDLDRMTRQCRAWLEAVRVIDRWLLPTGDRRTLGSVLKTIPGGEAELLRAHLVAAGVLPADAGGVL